MTAPVIFGRAVAGAIVWTPDPEMLKCDRVGSRWALASVIAWRSDPAPESAVVVTVYVSAPAVAGPAAARRSESERGRSA